MSDAMLSHDNLSMERRRSLVRDEAQQEISFPEGASPAAQWEQDSAKRVLDELFSAARKYQTSASYHALLRFIARFRQYSPYNAGLVFSQMDGAQFVAPANRWLKQYQRQVRLGARPLVILKPMGPVMFVYDVSDTEPLPNAPPLPPEVEHPFEVRGGSVGSALDQMLGNVARDGIFVAERDAGSLSAGEIRPSRGAAASLEFVATDQKQTRVVRVPRRYEVLLNSKHSSEAKYATLVHELGHLYCGHLGTPDPRWWPDRRGLKIDVRELEAESVCYLVCTRLGIDNPSDEYLAEFVKQHGDMPAISLDCILRAASLIEQMGQGRMPPRKEKKS